MTILQAMIVGGAGSVALFTHFVTTQLEGKRMPKFRVCLKGEMPAEDCILEADNANEAAIFRYQELCDWADSIAIETEPLEEATVDECKG